MASGTGVKKLMYWVIAGLFVCSTMVNAHDEERKYYEAEISSAALSAATNTAQVSPLEVANPMTLAATWLQNAKTSGALPEYAVLGTMKEMYPSIKLISMGELTPEGYVFKLNEGSDTTQEINESPDASVLLAWSDKSGRGMQKQIRIYGTIEPQGAIESHTLTYQGAQLDYKSRRYILKPEGMQLALINAVGSSQAGVVEFVNYQLTNGHWSKAAKKQLGFDRSPSN